MTVLAHTLHAVVVYGEADITFSVYGAIKKLLLDELQLICSHHRSLRGVWHRKEGKELSGAPQR